LNLFKQPLCPPKQRQTSKRLVEQEGRILLAISALKKKEIPSIRRAATVFDIPYTTLYSRTNGCNYRAEKRANGHKMTLNEEIALAMDSFCGSAGMPS
jgi:hypothetical protein